MQADVGDSQAHSDHAKHIHKATNMPVILPNTAVVPGFNDELVLAQNGIANRKEYCTMVRCGVLLGAKGIMTTHEQCSPSKHGPG